MNYNGYYPNYGFSGYQQPSATNNPQPTGPIWVQGESGAKSYMVAPGNTVVLFDSEKETFYIKTTDASGMPQPLKVYDYAERQPQAAQPQVDLSQYVTKDELTNMLDEWLNSKTAKAAKPKGETK